MCRLLRIENYTLASEQAIIAASMWLHPQTLCLMGQSADQLGEVPTDSPKLPFCGRRLQKPPAVVAWELGLNRWAGFGQVWLEQAGEIPPGWGWSVRPWVLPAQSRGAPRGLAGLTRRAGHSHRAWPTAALEYLLVSVKEAGGDGRS